MPEAFKDQFFSPAYLQQFAQVIHTHYPSLSPEELLAHIRTQEWPTLELKARMRHITHALGRLLPQDFAEAVHILQRAAPQTQGFGNMIYPDFVEVYGLEHWELAMQSLELFTQYGSSEFAIRPFIAQYPAQTMQRMQQWAEHANEHVRRLSTEGCRSRLPWAMALPQFKADPSPIVPILERLRNDPSEYVRKSVANNLNDISKDHPELVLTLAQQWHGQTPATDRIIKHALRTLLKAGNTQALMLFNFADPAHIHIQQLRAQPTQLRIGDTLHFDFELENTNSTPTKLRIEYIVHYQKLNQKTSPKVFQFTEREFPSGTSRLSKNQSFQERSTRKHHAGQHKLDIVVNGVCKASVEFVVEK